MSQITILKDAPDEGLLVIQLGSILDNNNIDPLAKTLTQAHADGYKQVVIDCSRLEFISSAGIGVIVSKNRLFNRNEGELVLFDIPEIVMFVLTELDVAELLTIRSNLGTFMTTG